MVDGENVVIDNQDNNLTQENIISFKKKFLSFFGKVSNFLKKSQEKVKILIPIAGICFVFMLFMIGRTIYNLNELNKSSNTLYTLDNFNINRLKENENTKDIMMEASTINDLLEIDNDVNDEISRYKSYMKNMQAPYENLMKHLFLPELNIWKDLYFGDVDTTIIGSKFLQKNPYNDITLIDTWTNFFKNVGGNYEYNEIDSIEIGDLDEIKADDIDIFYIPLTIKFTANSKRSFLLLIENLSITSNQKNIALISEFMYNLRNNIKNEKQEEIGNLKEKFDTGVDEDTIIGYNLYNWIKGDGVTSLLDDDIITQSIKDTVSCTNDTSFEYCMYKFRDKFRGIPSLAYTIGFDGKNMVSELKKFLKGLPPIIKINSFSFNKKEDSTITNYGNIAYEGELSMNIYGKGISDGEVSEISEILGNLCNKSMLTPENAITSIEDRLVNIGNTTKIDAYSTSNLIEIEKIIQDIQDDYDNLSNYNKIIKLFEIYRMMKEGNLCN